MPQTSFLVHALLGFLNQLDFSTVWRRKGSRDSLYNNRMSLDTQQHYYISVGRYVLTWGGGGRHFCSRFYTIKFEGDRVAPLARPLRLAVLWCFLLTSYTNSVAVHGYFDSEYMSRILCPVYYIRLLLTAWLSLSAHLAKRTKCFY